MDYRQKMVVAPQKNIKNDDDDDEDLEALRLAALQSLRTKDTVHNKKPPPPQVQMVVPQVMQMSRPPFKGQRIARRGYFHNRMQQRQNGNLYYQSPRNPNLIAIVPVDEHPPVQQIPLTCPEKVEKTDSCVEPYSAEISKFHRFKDTGSGSEEEDNKDHKNSVATTKTDANEKEPTEPIEALTEIENQAEAEKTSQKNDDDQEDVNDDDDDILLMADLEEEDSLERLMDEMEREMNVGKPSDKKDRKSSKKETRSLAKFEETIKSQDQKTRLEAASGRKENSIPATTLLVTNMKNERRSMSPHGANKITQKRRSLSPKSRSRKKSPRRSPRRSPIRQLKKTQREITRYRSPRKSPLRYSPRSRSPKLSPRPRSPRLSPRRSPNRSPLRRSPLRKLSPRGRSPKHSPHSRSPRPPRSRSPRILSRSKSPRPLRSPKVSRSRSPRLPRRSKSPRYSSPRLSPTVRSPRSKSPRLSPRRISPRRLSPRLRSPGLSPLRRSSPRLRSPKMSPRRVSPRLRSPRLSPRRSPWSSPRNSPRLSPRRRRSPKWSPKEPQRKHGPRSITPDMPIGSLYVREVSPMFKGRASPEVNRIKGKQREENYEKNPPVEKEPPETINDPVLEARRRKFESTRPIDPINANKKIKLSKKDTTSKKAENTETTELSLGNITRKVNKAPDEYDVEDTDLCLDTAYEFEDLEETIENNSPLVITNTVNSCINVEAQKAEKDRLLKKKKKRDKEIYQVGKLKNELPLSERIGKDKKCKKRKDVITDGPSEDVEAIFEDIVVDEEGDLRTELSRRRAERLNRTVPIQSARLVQSAFQGVVNEVVKNNAKANQRHVIKTEEKSNQKEVRRVTVLHRSVSDLHDSEDESTLDSKVPVRFRLGLNKQVQDNRESKVSRKASKRQGRKE
ncbi:hypothetical protein KM043_002211 [Ampulex compressa]|nr:hypothetical protein KM043_002211 [Ampulex compressa]